MDTSARSLSNYCRLLRYQDDFLAGWWQLHMQAASSHCMSQTYHENFVDLSSVQQSILQQYEPPVTELTAEPQANASARQGKCSWASRQQIRQRCILLLH